MIHKLTQGYVANLEPEERLYDVHDTEIKGFVLRVRPSGKKTYYLFYKNSERKKRTYTIGSGITATQARDIAQKKLAEVLSGIDLNARDTAAIIEAKRLDSITLGSFLENRYKQHLVDNRRTGLATYKRLKKVFDCFADKRLDAVTRDDMEQWRRDNKDKANGTIRNDVTELKTMLNRAKLFGIIEQHKLENYRLPKGTVAKKRVRYLLSDERERLYLALEDRERTRKEAHTSGNTWRLERGYDPVPEVSGYFDHLMPIVLIALNTGMRRGEIFKLKWSEVSFDTNIIKVELDTAKGIKERYFPINEHVQNVLLCWRNQTSESNVLVFPSGQGEAFDNIDTSWRNLIKSAGIDNFRFHDLRHDFASQLVMAGVDLYSVKELLGHSSITQTERYAHLAPEKLTAAVAVLN